MNDYKFGQWIGDSVNGDGSKVRMILNFEERSPGVGQAMNHVPAFPDIRVCSKFVFPEVNAGSEVVADFPDVRVFDVTTGVLEPAAEFYKRNSIDQPANPRTTFRFDSRGRVISGLLITEKGLTAKFHLTNTTSDLAKEADHTLTWSEFKEFVASNVPDNGSIIFRGQGNNSHKLRTIWHRRGRNNLVEYLQFDIPKLRNAINAASQFKYSHDDDDHLGLLLSLAQHHGYPTPLLDWTLSPKVAAFFGFHKEAEKDTTPEAARIFMFDPTHWRTKTPKKFLCDPLPELHFLGGLAHPNNLRHAPQQSVSSFSNVDDIETFIRAEESLADRKFLTTIDIPIMERKIALDDLKRMGIDSESLFPSFEGICRILTECDFQ